MWPLRWRRKTREHDLERELRSDLELEIAEQEAHGLSPEEARYAAQRAFGNTTLVKEATREMWGWTFFERCVQDLRYAMRVLRKAPGFTAVALLSLALGIGANTAVFSLLDAVLLKNLQVRDPARLRILTWGTSVKVPLRSYSGYETRDARTGQDITGSFSYHGYRLLSATVPQFSDLVAYAANSLTVTVGGTSEYAIGHFVSGNYFTGLGAEPLVGRPILPEDDSPGVPGVAVLTYRYWEKRFGLDPAIIGREILVNRRPLTVVGVMPPGFQGLHPGRAMDFFLPLAMVDDMGPTGYSKTEPDNWWLQIFGRLRPGVSDNEAAAAVRATLAGVIREFAGNVSDSAIPRVLLAPGGRGVGLFREYWSNRIYILSVTAGLVLLIACLNLANLLLARAAGRQHEIGVRLSIGASRGRLLRQLFTESLLLAGVGGLLGVILAKPLCGVLLRYAGGDGSLTLDARIDARSLAFTLGLSLLTGVLFGIAPAWRATRIDLSPAMKGRGHGATGSGGRMRVGRLLVSAQVALSVLLLVGAGMFVRTLVTLSKVDLGFRPERLLTFRTDPSRNGYEGQALADIYSRMRRRIAAIPGVESVGMSHYGLIQGAESGDDVYIPGRQVRPGDPGTYVLYCSDSFLSTMRIPMMLGRDLSAGDGPATPLIAVVNQTFAKQYFDGTNPVGETFSLGKPAARPIRIVGVAKDAHYNGVRAPVPPTSYIPYAQYLPELHQMTFAIRTVLPPLSIAGAVRLAVAEISPTIPVADLRTQEDQIQSSLGTERLFAGLVSSFGALAALLAAIGLYGVLAYTVARRTAEIGIRIALGATSGNVQWLVLRESLLTVVLGILVGVPAALALTRLIRSMLYGITPTDSISFVAALMLMIVVTAVAAWVPARRAARVDPMIALRCE
jgi:predicted permease